MFKNSIADGFAIKGFIDGIKIIFKVVSENLFGIGSAIKRVDAAKYIVSYCGF